MATFFINSAFLLALLVVLPADVQAASKLMCQLSHPEAFKMLDLFRTRISLFQYEAFSIHRKMLGILKCIVIILIFQSNTAPMRYLKLFYIVMWSINFKA